MSIGTLVNMRRTFAAVAILCALVLTACGSNEAKTTTTTAKPPPPKKEVIVTTPVLVDFVNVISGGVVNVRSLTPENSDVRNHVVTPDDVTDVAKADLIIENGLGLEPWFDSFIKSAEHRGPVVAVTTGVNVRTNELNVQDPYAWMSPSNARVMVANVRQALERIIPDAKGQMLSNERAYYAQIDDAIRYSQSVLGGVANNRLVYAGEPLGYFCEQFKLRCTAVPTVNVTGSGTPQPQKVTAVVDSIKAANPVAVIFGHDVSPAVVDATKQQLPQVKVTSGNDTLRVASVGEKSKRHPNYVALIRDTADLVSMQLRTNRS